MSDLEEISHISRQAIHQKFKKHLGKTPIQFLQEVRMRESKTFLLNTNLFCLIKTLNISLTLLATV